MITIISLRRLKKRELIEAKVKKKTKIRNIMKTKRIYNQLDRMSNNYKIR